MENPEGGAVPPPADPLKGPPTTTSTPAADGGARTGAWTSRSPLPPGAKAAAGAPKGVWAGGLGSAQAETGAGGSGSAQAGSGAPSFAEILMKSSKLPEIPVAVHQPAATDQGEPAAFFSVDEKRISCSPFEHSIIVKTPRGRPPFQVIRTHLSQRFRFSGNFVIAPFDERHLTIRFANEEDYLKLLLKESMSVQGRLFRFAKWDHDFLPEVDSPIVPVWLALPRLPANYFCEPMLRSIACSVGTVLRIADCTLNATMLQAAHVCVQLDVSKKLPERVWIGIGSGGFWQPIEYPNPTYFCTGCNKLGHSVSHCRQGASAGSLNKDTKGAHQVFDGNPQRTGKDKNAKPPPPIADPTPVWRAVTTKESSPKAREKEQVAKQDGGADLQGSSSRPATSMGGGIAKQSYFHVLDGLDEDPHTPHHGPQDDSTPLAESTSEGGVPPHDKPQIPTKIKHVGDAPGAPIKKSAPTSLLAAQVLDQMPQQEAFEQNDANEASNSDADSVLDVIPQRKTGKGKHKQQLPVEAPAGDSSSGGPNNEATQISLEAARVDPQMPQTGTDDPNDATKAPGLVDDDVPLKLPKRKARKGENKPPTPTEENAISLPHDVVSHSGDDPNIELVASSSDAAHVLDDVLQQGAEDQSAETGASRSGVALVLDEIPQRKVGKGKNKQDTSSEGTVVSLPITHDVMTFPGIPEPQDDIPPKVHMGRQRASKKKKEDGKQTRGDSESDPNVPES